MLLQYVGESEGTKSTVTVPESIRECDPNRFLAMLLHIWWVGPGVRISEDKERASETITKTCPEQGKLSSFVGSIFVVSLCFKNCSQYLGSTFSQQTYLSSSSRQLRWSPMSFKFKSAFLEPKELLWLFHVSFLDFLFLLLSAGNSQLDLSCPAFSLRFRLRHGHVYLDGHRDLILNISSTNQFLLHNSSPHWNQYASEHPGSEPRGKLTLHTPN